MSERVKKPRPERDQTDESLRTERVNSDKVLEQRRSAIEQERLASAHAEIEAQQEQLADQAVSLER